MLNNNNDHEVLYAGFLVRLWAYIIDCIIVGGVMLIIKIPVFFVSIAHPELFLFKNILFNFNIVDVATYLLSIIYFISMTYYYGATFGKRAMKIKVLKENEEKLPFIDVLYRETIGRYLSRLILFVGYILIGLDGKKRGLHDMLCDTIVVYDIKNNKDSQRYIDSNFDNNNNIVENNSDEDIKGDM